jgi:PHD/YefM family antitoxin component YafN of YafNO toxin-antitoxin module
MAKTVSVAQLGHGGASRAIREAQQEPVLVSKANRPAAWIFSAEKLAQVAASRGPEAGDAYQQAL